MPHEMNRFVLIESPLERVWSAMTESAQLTRWFCRKANIRLEPGGAFELDSTVPHASGKHRTLQVEPGRLLRIEWMIRENPTEVSLLLENFRGITRVSAKHQVPDDFPDLESIKDSLGNITAGLEYLWCYAFILLKSYLRDAETQLRLESESDPLGIEWHTTIAAAPADVFKALVDPQEIKKWNPYCGDNHVEPRVGGRYAFGWDTETAGTDGPDRIVEFQDNHKVTYTWHGQEPKTLVSWTVQPLEGGKTKLHFTHSGFLRNPKVVLEYKLGWAHFLYALKMSVETKQSMDDWNGRLTLGSR